MTLTVDKFRRALEIVQRDQRERSRIARWPRLAQRAEDKRARAFRSRHTRRQFWGLAVARWMP